jgi:hypothetical protein
MDLTSVLVATQVDKHIPIQVQIHTTCPGRLGDKLDDVEASMVIQQL